jgi:dolichol-phosphate mannosyltransferase
MGIKNAVRWLSPKVTYWSCTLPPSAISLVVPICNEAGGLPRLANRLEQLRATAWPKYELEIVLVDDGSLDNSRNIAQALFASSSRVIITAHEKNLGLGAAIRTGWRQASGEIICTLDADCTYDPAEILKLLEALESGADVATGSPYHPQGQVVNAVGWRLLLSHGASQLYRWVSGERLFTFTSLMRAYRRPVIEEVKFSESGFVSVAEILLRAIRAGYRVVEVPMALHTRVSGSSKMKIARTITAHLGLMARAILWRKPDIKSLVVRPPYRTDSLGWKKLEH